MQYGPDPNAIYPNEKIKSVCYIKNIITRPNIIVGDYTYYDDNNGAGRFEEHVTHHYEFLGDKLIIGKFCAIAKGIEFVMNGANHRMCSITTYPFNIMEAYTRAKTEFIQKVIDAARKEKGLPLQSVWES